MEVAVRARASEEQFVSAPPCIPFSCASRAMVIGACSCKRQRACVPPWRAEAELRRAQHTLDNLQRLADQLGESDVELSARREALEKHAADVDKRESALTLREAALNERERGRALSSS